ncbi:MAG TPA: class II aldolase/adducin family protein [Methylophilaceae bacterium]|nr:class II aldolase/adducin family protein [Methylophilaceae bacterium]HQR61052.1 class II aldolase/adducin family protein [Methylophilaceae bacterium]
MTHLREQLLAVTRKLSELGLNRGTAGNASVRDGTGFLVTPSGMSVEAMTPHDMVWVDFDGNAQGERKPSSEWRFHRDILHARPEVGAVIHTHAMFATTLACLRRDVPPFHYMIAVAGGDSLRCAPYALFGTQALSDAALTALQDRKACLLANHGMIAVGRDLEAALAMTQEVETLCEQYWRTLQVGGPTLLTPQEMDEALEQFKDYGRWRQESQ